MHRENQNKILLRLPSNMTKNLDERANELGISRTALLRMLINLGLNLVEQYEN